MVVPFRAAGPADVLARILSERIRVSLGQSAIVRKRRDLGSEIPTPDQQTPTALASLQRAEIAKWWPVIAAADSEAA
jgi:hypothetical protein